MDVIAFFARIYLLKPEAGNSKVDKITTSSMYKRISLNVFSKKENVLY